MTSDAVNAWQRDRDGRRELTGSSGLGGRAREASSSAERARVLVGRNSGQCWRKFAANPALGRHLATAISSATSALSARSRPPHFLASLDEIRRVAAFGRSDRTLVGRLSRLIQADRLVRSVRTTLIPGGNRMKGRKPTSASKTTQCLDQKKFKSGSSNRSLLRTILATIAIVSFLGLTTNSQASGLARASCGASAAVATAMSLWPT